MSYNKVKGNRDPICKEVMRLKLVSVMEVGRFTNDEGGWRENRIIQKYNIGHNGQNVTELNFMDQVF